MQALRERETEEVGKMLTDRRIEKQIVVLSFYYVKKLSDRGDVINTL